MIEKFLNAKAWQVFMIVFVLPYSLQILAMVITDNDYDKMKFLSPIITLIFLLVLFGWFYSIVSSLKNKIPEGMKIKFNKFRWLLIISIIYLPIAFELTDWLLDNQTNSNGEPNSFMIICLLSAIPIHILSVCGFLYSFYFTAKVYKSVLFQGEVTLSDFVLELFLLIFFPIGIWVIHPKVKKLVKN